MTWSSVLLNRKFLLLNKFRNISRCFPEMYVIPSKTREIKFISAFYAYFIKMIYKWIWCQTIAIILKSCLQLIPVRKENRRFHPKNLKNSTQTNDNNAWSTCCYTSYRNRRTTLTYVVIFVRRQEWIKLENCK